MSKTVCPAKCTSVVPFKMLGNRNSLYNRLSVQINVPEFNEQSNPVMTVPFKKHFVLVLFRAGGYNPGPWDLAGDNSKTQNKKWQNRLGTIF